MARPLRIAFPGGVYHVTARGDRQEAIFIDDRDRLVFIRTLGEAMDRFDASVFAYCLMGNHFHIVIQTRRANLSQVIRHVNGVYAQAFNRRHGLVGHLFQGRFKSIHVDRDAYLMEVCRYTELNPVRAGLVQCAHEWRWSSYRSHCGLTLAPAWLETQELHGRLLGHDVLTEAHRNAAERQYAVFVEAGRDGRLWEERLQQEIFLGDGSFIERIRAQTDSRDLLIVEVPRIHRQSPNVSSKRLEFHVARDESMRRAYADGAMNMSEIAREVGLSVSRVSRVIKNLERTRAAASIVELSEHVVADKAGGEHREAKGKT